MTTALFLQGVGIGQERVERLFADLGLPCRCLWGDWRAVASPEEVRIIVTVNARVDREVLDRFPKAQMVAVCFTGYDHVALEACRERRIKVYNVPAYSTDSVAELTVGLAIALLRDIPAGDREIRAVRERRDEWWRQFGPGRELAGMTVGIVGTGAIGLRVAELFAAFRCSLLGWTREGLPSSERAEAHRQRFAALGGRYASLGALFAQAGIVTIHVAMTPQTKGLIGRPLLCSMQPGACLINASRGPVIDTPALVEVLSDSKRGIRAALDVFDVEPLPSADPLLQLGRAVLTPHVGYKTQQALERRIRVTADNIRAFIEGREENRVA